MAVCGCCWICRRKLDCGEGHSCHSCDMTSTHAATVEGHGLYRYPSDNPVQICRDCVGDIESGILMSMIDIVRELREQAVKQAKEAAR